MQQKQLLLINDFYNPSYLESDYIISSSNSLAYNAIISNAWLSYCMILHGSPGSGKTHLAQIWKTKVNAEFFSSSIDSNRVMFSACVIEDIDKNSESIQNELQILHSYNNAIESKQFLLLTSTLNPYQLNFSLPDLRSRIQAVPSVRLGDPDDELLRVIIIKEFHIRALKLDVKVINFILLNLERSVAGIIKFINFLDRESLKNKKSITVQSISSMIKDFYNSNHGQLTSID